MQFPIKAQSAQLNEDDFQTLVDGLKYKPVQDITSHALSSCLRQHNSTFNINKLKNELYRLSEKCFQPLDFRWKVEGLEADKVDVLGMTHFLDEHSVKFLINEIKRFNMVYTVGAYEATKKFFEQNKVELLKKQQALKTDIRVVRLCKEYMRGEERMFFAKSVTISPLSDNTVKQNFELTKTEKSSRLEGVTSNISKSGLKIRSAHGFNSGQYVAICFEGLKKELVFAQPHIIYRVVKVKRLLESNTYEYILEIQRTPKNAEFKSYLLNLIYSHKHKYKVDLNSTTEAAFAKHCEQNIIEHSGAITLYFSRDNDIKYCLVNQQSQSIEKYFEGENRVSLQRLFDDMNIIEKLKEQASLFLFVAKGKSKTQQEKGQSLLIAETLDNKEQSEFVSTLTRFAELNSSMLFKLNFAPVNPAMAFRMSTVPSESQQIYGSSRIHRYAKSTKEVVNRIQYLVSMTPIKLSLMKGIYTNETRNKVNGLKTYTCDSMAAANVQLIEAETCDKRTEDRFSFSTPVGIQVDGENVTATTIDISSLGLSVAVPHHFRIPTNEFLNISFLDYEKNSTLYNLSDCKYKVVSCKKGLLRLSNRMISHHDGREFWHKFILKRIDHLKVKGREKEHVGLSRSLGNLYLGSLSEQVLFYKTDNNRPVITAAVDNFVDLNREANIIDNLRRWFYDDNLSHVLQNMIENADDTQDRVCWALINFKKNLSFLRVESAFGIDNGLLEESLTGLAQLNQKSLNDGSQVVLQLSFNTSGETRNRYLLDEMSYIKRYAPHKHLELSEAMSEIKGSIIVTDVSDVVTALMATDQLESD